LEQNPTFFLLLSAVSERQLHSLTKSGQLVKIRRGVYATSRVMARAETDPGLRHALDVVAVRDTRTGKGVASHHSGEDGATPGAYAM
jgi:hypothetical protein